MREPSFFLLFAAMLSSRAAERDNVPILSLLGAGGLLFYVIVERVPYRATEVIAFLLSRSARIQEDPSLLISIASVFFLFWENSKQKLFFLPAPHKDVGGGAASFFPPPYAAGILMIYFLARFRERDD